MIVEDIPDISLAASDLNIKFENLFGGKVRGSPLDVEDWYEELLRLVGYDIRGPIIDPFQLSL